MCNCDETTFENASVGDKVWDIHYGWGTIKRNKNSDGYPIIVEFNLSSGHANKVYYTYDGKSDVAHVTRALFWDEVKIDPPKKPVRLPQKYDKIMVRDCDTEFWKPRYFHAFAKVGNKVCTVLHIPTVDIWTGHGCSDYPAGWLQWRWPTKEELEGHEQV